MIGLRPCRRRPQRFKQWFVCKAPGRAGRAPCACRKPLLSRSFFYVVPPLSPSRLCAERRWVPRSGTTGCRAAAALGAAQRRWAKATAGVNQPRVFSWKTMSPAPGRRPLFSAYAYAYAYYHKATFSFLRWQNAARSAHGRRGHVEASGPTLRRAGVRFLSTCSRRCGRRSSCCCCWCRSSCWSTCGPGGPCCGQPAEARHGSEQRARAFMDSNDATHEDRVSIEKPFVENGRAT